LPPKLSKPSHPVLPPGAVQLFGGAGPGVLNLGVALTPPLALGGAVSGTPKIPRNCGGTERWPANSASSRLRASVSGVGMSRRVFRRSLTEVVSWLPGDCLGPDDDGPWRDLKLEVRFLGMYGDLLCLLGILELQFLDIVVVLSAMCTLLYDGESRCC